MDTRTLPRTKIRIFPLIRIGKFHFPEMVTDEHEITRSWEITPQDGRYAVQAGRAVERAAGFGNRHGGIMRIGRALIVPAILALGVAGSLLTGSAMPAAAGHDASVHVQAAAVSLSPNTLYHC